MTAIGWQPSCYDFHWIGPVSTIRSRLYPFHPAAKLHTPPSLPSRAVPPVSSTHRAFSTPYEHIDPSPSSPVLLTRPETRLESNPQESKYLQPVPARPLRVNCFANPFPAERFIRSIPSPPPLPPPFPPQHGTSIAPETSSSSSFLRTDEVSPR